MKDDANQINVNDLLALIGTKEVEIAVLRRTVAQLQAALKESAGNSGEAQIPGPEPAAHHPA